MIYRPHFTYIEAATPEQKQAREAAANEEWRKRLILHSITPEWHPPRPEHKPKPVHILPLPIVRPHPEHEEWRIFHPEWHPEYRSNPPRREPIINPPGIHILPLPIIRPYENRQEHEPPHGTPVRTPVGTPVHLPNDIHILPSPKIRQEQHESNEKRPVGITITQPTRGKPLMLPPIHRPEPIVNPPIRIVNPLRLHIVPSPVGNQEQNESNERGTPVRTPVGTPVRLPSDIHIVPSPVIRQEQQESNRPVGITITQPHHGIPLMLPPSIQTHETSNTSPPPRALVGRILSGIEHAEGVSTSPPLQQTSSTSPQTTVHQTVPATIGRTLSAIERAEGVSTSPPPLQQTTWQNPQQIIDNMISQGVNLQTSPLPSGNPLGLVANAASRGNAAKSQPSNPFAAIGSFFGSLGSDITNAAKDVGNAITGALSTANNAIQNAYASAYGTKPQNASNPFQQFFNDIAEGSALVGYYGTEALGGVGEELAHIAQGKGLENFSQAVSQFNRAGGQNVAKAVGDVTEVALPAIATAIVAPELLPAELIGEAASVGIGEGISKLTTGKWQSLPQVLQEANEGGVLGVIGGAAGSALEGGLARLGTYVGGKVGDIIAGAGGKALAGAAVNEALTAPFTRNPEQLLLSGVLGAAGGAAGELVSKVPFLEQSEAVRNAIDTSEAGAKLGNELVNEGITKGVLTPEDIEGKTTTQIGDLLRQKYNTVSNDIISSLDKDTAQSLKEEGIITDDQVLKPDEFIKSVKGKIPDDQLQLLKDTADLVEKYNEGIEKLVGGWKIKLGNRTLLYRLKLGDESELGFGSAGKSEIFNDIRSIEDIEKNVAGIYNNPSDVRDTAIGLKTPKEAEFLQNLYDAAKSTKSALSELKPTNDIELGFKDLEKDLGPDQTKMLAQTVKDYLENEVGDKNVIVYGSNSVKQYLEDIASRLGGTLDKDSDPNAYLIKRGDQVLWQWRKPGDVDVFIRTDNPNDLQRIAQDLADRMNKAIGTDRFEAEGNLVIDKIGGGEHVVDLHMMNEASDNFNLYARGSTGADLGMARPTPNYSDLGIAKVSQIALDKANAVAGLRDISLNDLLTQINEGVKPDNPDYVVYIAKQILQGKDPETVEDALAYFVRNIKDDNLRDYLADRFSQEFNIPKDELFTKPIGNIEDVLNERYRYLSPASYRFKDAQDFLTLLKLAADLKDDDDLRALYEQLRDEFEERGIIPKDWKPKEIDWNSIQNAQKLIDSLSSAGDLRSMFFTSPIISLGVSSGVTSSISSPPSPIVSPPPSPIVSPPSPIINSPPSPIISPPSPIINSPPSPIVSPPPSPIISPPSPIVSPPSPIISPPSPIVNLPPSPIISLPSLPSYYIQQESQSPPPVFSPSSVTESESPLPMAPPPMLPAMAPGGFGGGGNNVKEISGMAGEVIYL